MNGRLLVVACVMAAVAGFLVPARAVTPATPAASGPHGMHPMQGDRPVPHAWLPPGAQDPDSGPSTVIYPPQKITIRFNHTKHVSKEIGAKCTSCHGKVTTSRSAQDKLLPDGSTCDTCHDTDHSDLKHVKGGSDEMGKCGFCHLGYTADAPNRVAPFDAPRAQMRFNHKIHLDRNINCAQCHGAVDQVELPPRDQLPRMKGCFGCHAASGAAQGQAKSACNTCHTTAPDGRLQTFFASGELRPPRWLNNAEHTPDFIERHKRVAADNSALCANCHTERYCADCHDGKIRPRSVHPNDWISMHPVAARQDNPRCTSCHQEQSFCLMCHQRVGVTMAGANVAGHQFHPPGWVTFPGGGIRGAGHHAWEAQRNLNACVSCHTERDCAMCHASTGRAGLGVNPHPPSFAAKCATQFKRNARPCLVCHEVDSKDLQQCQ